MGYEPTGDAKVWQRIQREAHEAVGQTVFDLEIISVYAQLRTAHALEQILEHLLTTNRAT